MSEELIKRFRVQLGRKQFTELEDTWLELLQLNLPLKELLNLIDLVQHWAKDYTPPLLWVLATALADQHRYHDELVVLRRLVELTPEDGKLTQEITSCLRQIYPDEPLLERLFSKSGLGYGESLSKALERFNLYSKLTPGKLVYDPVLGPGKVIKLDLLFDRVTVAFKHGGELVFDITAACSTLTFPAFDGFFALEESQPQHLKKLALNDPSALVSLLLRDTYRWMSSADIEKYLAPVVGWEKFSGFWEKARRGLSRHPNIETKTRPNRIYRWIEEPKKKTADPSTPSEKKTGAPPCFDYSRLKTMSREEIIATFQNLRTTTERKKILKEIALQRSDDWETLYRHLFPIAKDNTTRRSILEKLKEAKPATYHSLVESTLTAYRSEIEPFLFLAETHAGHYRPIFTRLLDLLETKRNRSLENRIKKLCVAEHYKIIRETLVEITEMEAKNLLERIRRTRILEPFQQDEIAALFLERFSTLKIEPPDNFIWSTSFGIENAKAELKRLSEEELPRSGEEIARARSFGDLSENYEYKAAKEKQSRLMEKINRLRNDLSRANPIAPEKIDTSKVNIGCRVKLQDEEGKGYEYSILGPWDADPENGIISFQSPLAQKLLGKQTGETVTMGGKSFTITEITPAL